MERFVTRDPLRSTLAYCFRACGGITLKWAASLLSLYECPWVVAVVVICILFSKDTGLNGRCHSIRFRSAPISFDSDKVQCPIHRFIYEILVSQPVLSSEALLLKPLCAQFRLSSHDHHLISRYRRSLIRIPPSPPQAHVGLAKNLARNPEAHTDGFDRTIATLQSSKQHWMSVTSYNEYERLSIF
jgi:hypothetical protein